MKKVLLIFVSAVLLLGLFSCTTFKFSGAQITKEIPSYQKVGEFSIVVPVTEWLGSAGGANILNISADSMDTKIYDAIQREIQKYTGDAAVNVVIEYKPSFVDILLNGVTAGIIAPAHAYVTGIIVKYSK